MSRCRWANRVRVFGEWEGRGRGGNGAAGFEVLKHVLDAGQA